MWAARTGGKSKQRSWVPTTSDSSHRSKRAKVSQRSSAEGTGGSGLIGTALAANAKQKLPECLTSVLLRERIAQGKNDSWNPSRREKGRRPPCQWDAKRHDRDVDDRIESCNSNPSRQREHCLGHEPCQCTTKAYQLVQELHLWNHHGLHQPGT